MTRDLLPRLKRFDTGVYLHQVIVDHGGVARYLDLPHAFEAFENGGARGEWRIHCHVPVFLETLGDLASTQSDLRATLKALRRAEFTPHLEVETYTWDVLPERYRGTAVSTAIARELNWVRQQLGA